MSVPPQDGPLEEARRVLASQAKMRAIKLYRDANRAGWAEAAEAVDRIRAVRAPAAATSAVTRADALAIGDALRAGNKIEAIKLYRAATGLGLKEAKDAVDAMTAGKGPGPRLPSATGRIIERRRISPVLALLALAALFGTVFGLVVLLFGR
jgi:ribosomal protein L7/L12